MPRTDEILLQRARAMRRERTPPERLLWHRLRGKRFAGIKFARQVVIGRTIADFAARSRRLAIELDGDTHSDEAADARRTAWLETQGYRVIRFTNSEVAGNMDGVLEAIAVALDMAPPAITERGQ